MKFLLNITFSMLLLFALIEPAFAEKVQLPVHEDCVKKSYQVYGDEQPQKGNFVEVDLDESISKKELKETKEDIAKQRKEKGTLSRLGTGLTDLIFAPFQSPAAPFAVVFKSIAEKSPLKKMLFDFLQIFYQNHTEKYHEFLDREVFGKAIQTISSFETATQYEEGMKVYNAECKDDNPKPNCVIAKALCSYEKYVGVLFHMTGMPTATNMKQIDDLQAALNIVKKRDGALLQEAVDSKLALDTAIEVYSNFYQTYLMHLRLKDVIQGLVKVRNRMSYLAELVSCIPKTFVGIATTKCD